MKSSTETNDHNFFFMCQTLFAVIGKCVYKNLSISPCVLDKNTTCMLLIKADTLFKRDLSLKRNTEIVTQYIKGR